MIACLTAMPHGWGPAIDLSIVVSARLFLPIVASIEEPVGNIFSSPCQVLVNTVNCVGVMGAGIALECRFRFREMYERYAELCSIGELVPGRLFLWTHSEPWVLNFPTKVHWKHESTLEIIKLGLEKFAATYQDRGIRSIAFPRLGTSHGGLAWSRVRPLMLDVLGALPDLHVEIYGFDPRAPDSLFPKLLAQSAGLSVDAMARRFGVRPQQARAVQAAISGGKVGNMIALQQADGVGVKTTEKIYKALCQANAGSEQIQLELF